jgi:hypothetical protein
MRLFRVEVYRDGELLEARIFPNHATAHIFAEHHRVRGLYVLVTYPRGEPWRDSRYMPASRKDNHESNTGS